jgi:hypothetical protein
LFDRLLDCLTNTGLHHPRRQNLDNMVVLWMSWWCLYIPLTPFSRFSHPTGTKRGCPAANLRTHRTTTQEAM